MSLLSLPDIIGMIVLMCVLGWFRRRHRDERVDVWLLGLYFILVEMVATSIWKGSAWLPAVSHIVALNSYLLAAVTFGWAARRDLLPGASHVPQFVLPAIPMFLLATMLGLDLRTSTPYLVITAVSLVTGLVYLLYLAKLQGRSRVRLVLIHLVIWLPMLQLAVTHQPRWVVYWGLACLYLLVAYSFRQRTRPECIGAWVIVVSFVIWAMCFLAYPMAQTHLYAEKIVEQIWNIQKFFVVIGMLLVLLEDETQLRRNEAMHDSLTGLPNRRLFDDRLAQALERSRRSGLSTAVFAIDLNGFKEVNDTYGHQSGDAVLMRVAERLKRKVRGADTIARCGGDEFVVVVNDLVHLENCRRIADSLRSAIEAVEVPGGARRLGGSIGYAVFPEDADDMQSLYQLADLRMYAEKRSGQESDVEDEFDVVTEDLERR